MIELSMRNIVICRKQSSIVGIKGYKYIADVGIINFIAVGFHLLSAKICSRQSAMRNLSALSLICCPHSGHLISAIVLFLYSWSSVYFSSVLPDLIHSSISLILNFQVRPILTPGIPRFSIQVRQVSRVIPRYSQTSFIEYQRSNFSFIISISVLTSTGVYKYSIYNITK